MKFLPPLLIAIAVGALTAPALAGAAASAPGTRGVVVQRDAKAHVVVIATRSGSLVRVNFARPNKLAMGTVLKLVGSKVTIVGHVHKAKLRGVVMRRHVHSFALSGNGSVLAVNSPSSSSLASIGGVNTIAGSARPASSSGSAAWVAK